MSAVDTITIKGFKSIRNLENFKLNGLNIFIGANGSGKSNFISFFKLLQSIINDNFTKYVFDNGGAKGLKFNGIKDLDDIYFETHLYKCGYKFTLYPYLGGCKIIEEYSYRGEYSEYKWEPYIRTNNDTASMVQESKSLSYDSEFSKPIYDAISSFQIYHFHDSSRKAGMRDYRIIQDYRQLSSDASNIAPFLYYLKIRYKYEYQEILDSVRTVIPFFDKFQLEIEEFGDERQINLAWHQKGSRYPMQPHQFSDGSIRFICLATALLQPSPPSTIILDEPELGLHPLAISILAELIQDASRRTQVIVATQSPALVDHFSIEDTIVVRKKHGASTFERLNEKDFNVWLERYSVGELWTKNVIEGGPVYE